MAVLIESASPAVASLELAVGVGTLSGAGGVGGAVVVVVLDDGSLIYAPRVRRLWRVADWTGAIVLRVAFVALALWALFALGSHGWSVAGCWTTGCF